MPPKFGTSGLRGLVVDLTDDLVAEHVHAFAAACPTGNGVFIGRDLRDSSPRIAQAAISAFADYGIDVTDCGAVATPALALSSMRAGCAAMMVTGSHIPADRNGLKFYTPEGEITKEHEQSILAKLGAKSSTSNTKGDVRNLDADPLFIDRYVSAYGSDALNGMHIAVYSHSTVGRDVLQTILERLGAQVTEIGRSETFIPVDTEAVDPDTRAQLKIWAAQGNFDAIVSMDGDGDRPLLTDESGHIVVGDVLGQITAKALKSKNVVTPVSSNTGVDSLGFDQVTRTKIGSPYVISGMEASGGDVVGYEANGGFLLGFNALGPKGALGELMTRDSVLPIVAVLDASKGTSVSELISNQPKRSTAADRLQEVPTETSKNLVAKLTENAEPLLQRIDGTFKSQDLTDGLRMTLTDHRVIHLRPSGNAPELRLYVEADTKEIAEATLKNGLKALRALVS